jgi:hypothetical protein
MTGDGSVDPLRFVRRGQSERLKKGRRKRTVRRVVLLAVALWGAGVVAGAALAGRQYLRTSSRFALRRIDIAPTSRAPAAELRRIIDRHAGANLFRLDVARMAAELGSVRWVRSVALKRILPDRLHCAVEERVPRGLARIGDRLWLVDDDGPIDLHGGETSDWSFPVFTGIDASDRERQRAQIHRGVELLEYLERLEPGLPSRVSEVDLGRDDRVGLHAADGGPELRIHPTDFALNMERYLTMRDYLATHFGDGAYIDLRFRDSIAFLPAISGRR